MLDPNGEYAKAFADRGDKRRLFRVPPVATGETPLDVPAWLWNGHEWAAVAHAQPGAQRPLLMQGLRELKSGNIEGVPREAMIRRYLASYSARITAMLNSGTQAFAGSPRQRFECAHLLECVASDCLAFAGELEAQEATSNGFADAARLISDIIEQRKSRQFYNDFSVVDLESARDRVDTLVQELPDFGNPSPISEDAPLYFDVNMLATHLEQVAAEQGGSLAGFISTLGLRIRGMLADQRLGAVIGHNPPTSFDDWLRGYVGDNGASNGPIAIIDLSLVPSEVVHIVVAVLARLVFESLQRYRRSNEAGLPLPTVLVLDEAHTFVRRSRDDDGPAATATQLCRETFERIAREGRKFGLGLVLASQRPSELSPTVLAQCNTFLLHRIVNDADQNLVARLVPDNVSGLLRELPSLPSRQAVLLGWATPIPVMVEVDELPEEQRPQSSDPDFWHVWTLSKDRSVDWSAIASEWSRDQSRATPED